jgi:transglutaminase-like putative cysteine protease
VKIDELMIPFRRRLAAILLSLAACLSATAASAAERWFVLSIADQPVGFLRENVAERDGVLVTELQTRLVLNRLGHRVEIGSTSTSRESAEGRLRGAAMELKMSDQITSIAAEVEDGAIAVRNRAGGKSFEQKVPYSGELLGPAGLRNLTLARLTKPGDALQVQTFSPDLGMLVIVSRTLLAAETVTSQGRPVAARKVEEKTQGYPSPRILWLDAEGKLLAAEEQSPFGVVRTSLSDETTARRTAAAGGELPAEAYTGTIARTQIRIPSARRLAWLKLRITHRNPELGWPDFDRPGQQVVEKTDKVLTVEISRRQPRSGPHPFPVPPTDATREYLEANAYVQSDEPGLRAKAREIVGDEKDLWPAALKLERWVAESMRFDLGIAMAPSVELFENRRGTCVGYATLLTTLARATGIPARLVLGYVYVDGMFGGHAWTEVLVGNDWIPIDAAIVGPGAADAARLAFLDASLRNGAGALSYGPAVQLYGHIDLRVLGYAVEGGPRQAVSEEARPYSVSGDVYRNPSLGIELTKPGDLRFIDLDGVWPETKLVGLAGPGGEKASLEIHRRLPWSEGEAEAWKDLENLIPGGRRGRLQIAGRPAYLVEAAGRAAVGLPGSEEIWILQAEGSDAAVRVRALAAGLRM